MDEFGYFLAAYIIVWIFIFGYVFRTSHIQKNLRRELNALKKEVETRG